MSTDNDDLISTTTAPITDDSATIETDSTTPDSVNPVPSDTAATDATASASDTADPVASDAADDADKGIPVVAGRVYPLMNTHDRLVAMTARLLALELRISHLERDMAEMLDDDWDDEDFDDDDFDDEGSDD